jgi:hypothetical protein
VHRLYEALQNPHVELCVNCYSHRMWLAQFVCALQFFKTPSGLCGYTVLGGPASKAKDFSFKEKKMLSQSHNETSFLSIPVPLPSTRPLSCNSVTE